MKKFLYFIILPILILFILYFYLPLKINPLKNGSIVLKPAPVTTYTNVQTKLAGPHDFPIYRNISKDGGINAFTSTKDFRNGLLQSLKSAQTKQGRFYQLIVNGRQIGWVNEKFFLRSKLLAAKHVSLTRNPYYSFPVRDAISYIADKHGTLIDPKKVSASQNFLNSTTPGKFTIKLKYHHLKTTINVHVRPNLNEGITVANRTAIAGPSLVKTFSGSSKSSSPNWNPENNYQPEIEINRYYDNKHNLMITQFYQPRFHSLTPQPTPLNQIGVIPQGISLKQNQLTVSYFSEPNVEWGHLVTYNLNHLSDPLKSQNLLTMKWREFKNTSRNIAVSPYMKLGHGQSIGMTKKYIYVLASSNKEANPDKSEEIFQISRKNYQINHLWTIKVWNRSSYYPRYFHNACFINSHLMYATFHNASKGLYEYWKLSRNGNTWMPTEIGTTQSDFVKNNSPLQGFTSSRSKFYLAFNDNLFIITHPGKLIQHYQFHTLRETEGIAVENDRPYIELARRPELLQIKNQQNKKN